MRTILNIIWLIFAGLALFLGYMLAGILLCIPIVTIPWAIVRVARRKIGFPLALIGVLLMTLAFFAGSSLMQSGIPA